PVRLPLALPLASRAYPRPRAAQKSCPEVVVVRWQQVVWALLLAALAQPDRAANRANLLEQPGHPGHRRITPLVLHAVPRSLAVCSSRLPSDRAAQLPRVPAQPKSHRQILAPRWFQLILLLPV